MTLDALEGIYPAIPTPVTAEGRLDEPSSRALIERVVASGVQGVVPLGGTGEYGALHRADRQRMAALSVQTVAGRMPVIAGVLDPGLNDALDAGKTFAREGVDALMVVTPYYTTPTQQGLLDYFTRYADESPVPVLIYEIPGRTRIAFAPDTLHRLSRHPNIIGMKACNTDFYQFLQVIAGVDTSFAVLSGEDTLFPLHVAAGAKGGVLLGATLLPGLCREICQLASTGRLPEALVLHRELFPLFGALFAETNPGPMKSVLPLLGIDSPAMLCPLREPGDALRRTLTDVLTPLLARDQRVI